MCVCMYVCKYVCMNVCTYVRTYARVFLMIDVIESDTPSTLHKPATKCWSPICDPYADRTSLFRRINIDADAQPDHKIILSVLNGTYVKGSEKTAAELAAALASQPRPGEGPMPSEDLSLSPSHMTVLLTSIVHSLYSH